MSKSCDIQDLRKFRTLGFGPAHISLPWGANYFCGYTLDKGARAEACDIK